MVGPQLARDMDHLPPGLGPWQCWHWELQEGIYFGAPNPRVAFPADQPLLQWGQVPLANTCQQQLLFLSVLVPF